MLKGTPFLFDVVLNLLPIVVSLTSIQAMGWGHRGHEIVASVAAQLLVEKEHMEYLRSNEFTLGYYANVPDVIWKNLGKNIYDTEHPLHYLDWGPKFIKVFGKPQNLPEDFAEYKNKMGTEFDLMLGESPWRIKQLFEICQSTAKDLTKDKQGPLMVCVGELSHYIGDLSQPLHVTDNFNGQMTDQKGIHAYFEDDMVDFLDPQLKVDVLKAALKKYDVEKKKQRTYGQRVRDLIEVSYNQVPEVLKLDKKAGRAETISNAKKYHKMITEDLVRGAVTTALVWREIFKNIKNFDNIKFYYFDGKPEYLQPSFMHEEAH